MSYDAIISLGTVLEKLWEWQCTCTTGSWAAAPVGRQSMRRPSKRCSTGICLRSSAVPSVRMRDCSPLCSCSCTAPALVASRRIYTLWSPHLCVIMAFKRLHDGLLAPPTCIGLYSMQTRAEVYLVKFDGSKDIQLLVQVLAICAHVLAKLKAALDVGRVDEVVHI